MCKVAKEMEPERLNLTLTPTQTKKLNNYIINVAQKQGKIPHAIKTKLLRWAFDEWFENYGENYDIDWSKKK